MENEKRDLKQDYLLGTGPLRPFYRHPFFPSADYAEVIRQRSAFPIDRKALVQELRRQNAGLADPTLAMANIDALLEPNTFTVTTGHQLCWLGGPMFTIYKILTAIKLAERIQAKHPDVKVVPVFWMATEDHDWEEINHFYPEAGRKVVYPAKYKGPVGRHVLESAALDAIKEQVPEALRAFYQPGMRLAEAFRHFIHHLFGGYGLVILDGDCNALKKLFTPWMKAELGLGGTAAQVRTQTAALEAAGYSAPVKPRDINLFYLGHGGRSGIQLEGEGIAVPDAGIAWSKETAQAAVEAHPQDFSPNVVLRPMFQEAILPNLAYVGGWAEMGYWMQLEAAFSHAGIPFPLLVPRMSGSIAPQAMVDEAATFGFQLPDFNENLQAMQERYLLQRWDPAPLEAAIGRILESYTLLAEALEPLDPTLATSTRGEQGRTESSLDNLFKKTKKALRNRDPKPYARIAALKNLLAPEQEKQERMLNFTAFPVPYPQLIAQLHAHCQPEAYSEAWIMLP